MCRRTPERKTPFCGKPGCEWPAQVVPLNTGGNLSDIPALIEATANRLRSGEFGNITAGACVLLDETGRPTVFGWGAADSVRGVGILTIGANWLASRLAIRD